MVTCPKCSHEFDPKLVLEVKELTEFVEALSADAKAAYAKRLEGEDSALEVQYLAAPTVVSLAMSMVHDDADKRERTRMARRMAHVYNRCVQEGWVVPGVMNAAHWIPMTAVDANQRSLLLVYPKVREDLQGHQGREKLNELLGGYYLFVQEGEYAHRDAWEAYAAANGLE